LEERRAAIQEIVQSRIEAMTAQGPPIDFVQEFAHPVPAMAICDLFGIDVDERHYFEPHVATMTDPTISQDARVAAGLRFTEFATRVVESKRERPGRDLISDLANSGELTPHEVVGITIELIGAGYHTTANMLALSVYFLLDDRRRWKSLREAVKADERLAARAVEELLRYLNLIQTGAFARTATEDVRIGDLVVKQGQSVWVSLAAANRDPAKFRNPDVFDPTRDASGHLAFSFGRHMCLGQHLARLELEVALVALMSRFPTLELGMASDDVSMFAGEHQIYGVTELQVTW
jgi:cytochrome P450